ncbi:zinc finger protein RFP-like [Sceloporus undulatus]|uniref:zinc finger protein RFP-like n=1 Tax=Sceloporus undulatus TaxID=8520 RepID=UPI001C4BF223|nr:zinc finger protein RFP-like [Sceloporus undulatus]
MLMDVKRNLERIMGRSGFENPMVFYPELELKIWEFCDTNLFLNCLMKQLKDAFLPRRPLQKANVTLDPDTAYSRFILSQDWKSVTWGDKCQDLPNRPQRFDTCAFLLGCQEFTSGRHFWEVSVVDEGAWNVGIARKSVRRKGPVGFGVKEGIWAVGKWDGRYWTTNHPHSPHLTLKKEPKRIRVSLNYEEGRVAFYDGDTRALLFTLSEASFAGEPLLPFFYVNGTGCLRISS